MKYSIGVIICAAGKGARAGFDKNKLLVPFMGSTALEKSITAFDYDGVDEIMVTASETDFNEIADICDRFPRTHAVLGGETRSQSVYNALQAIACDIVLIHDGARPFVTRKIIEGCIHSVKSFGSGVCAIPCTDTIAVAEKGKIQSIPDRNALYQIQTPQGFFRENILAAYTQAFSGGAVSYTDDSALFAAFCGKPTLCEGDKSNQKLTHADDFSEGVLRCGFGVDTHAFGKLQTYITLGGVEIPSETGLIAHSDGDVLVHALMDALLSAAGLKDIGYYFPDTDERWKDANSMQMLERVVQMLRNEGYGVQNVSIAVQAEKPRLAGYIDEMKNRLSSALKLDPTAVGVTAGTNEGLGYVGEGKGITVYARALLKNC